ncbi:MAG TPA: FAD-binding oxidoreductase [Pirellulales bacterium]|nr:FAD-binding oxidoreductase [Pirellulales bacterium]HVA50178.1 FAD-binding oxidoreductase [Pirellulales bacterium]
MTAGEVLPLTATVEPATQSELVEQVRAAFGSDTPLYPIGGGTSLGYGVPPKQKGLGVRLTGLNRIVDYPARDMTITVEAGITMSVLAAELAREGQRLPVDAAQSDRATLGGLIATNFSGPRRYGYGTLRDYVIGISAVDGRGTPFKAGGRVVKNVAGYDLCKLLTGSLGTLAVISQVTLKVRPGCEATAFIECRPADWDAAERLLAGLVTSRTMPVAIELLRGPYWQENAGDGGDDSAVGQLLVGFEGSKLEVDWQIEQLGREWREQAVEVAADHRDEMAANLWRRLTEFSAQSAPLVLKAHLRPSAVTSFMQLLVRIEPRASLQAHAGNGTIIASLAEFSAGDAARVIVQQLQPAAVAAGGGLVVLSCAAGELTRQATWGNAPGDAALMRAVKEQFDPKGLLNPGRFVYGV